VIQADLSPGRGCENHQLPPGFLEGVVQVSDFGGGHIHIIPRVGISGKGEAQFVQTGGEVFDNLGVVPASSPSMNIFAPSGWLWIYRAPVSAACIVGVG